MKIALSAGHNVYNNGIFDPGSIGHGKREADITKGTVRLLKPLLEGLGHTVNDITPYDKKFTRSKDAHIERANRVNQGGYDLYLDIHVNAGGGTGPETIVHNANNKAYPIAREITNSLANELNLTNRRGVKAKPSYWSVSMTKVPSIIIEAAFIDTKEDMDTLTPEKYAKGVAKVFGYKTKELPIISKSNATIEQMKEYARKKGATDTFISLADIFYEIGINLGINHSVAYCQSARETGFGKFGGVLDETYHNPCGLKTTQGGHNKDPEAHQRFSNWREGITAQYDHLALYAGHKDYPRTDSPDPRHFPYLKGKCKTVEALSNNWATDGVYGYAIVDMVKDLESTKVEKTHWAKKHYDSLINKGITINEERFNDNITRGEVFALLDRIVEG